MATNPKPPEKPWVVLSIKDVAPDTTYRYRVTGENHYSTPPEPFSWSVPNVDNPRYNLSLVTTSLPELSAEEAEALDWLANFIRQMDGITRAVHKVDNDMGTFLEPLRAKGMLTYHSLDGWRVTNIGKAKLAACAST